MALSDQELAMVKNKISEIEANPNLVNDPETLKFFEELIANGASSSDIVAQLQALINQGIDVTPILQVFSVTQSEGGEEIEQIAFLAQEDETSEEVAVESTGTIGSIVSAVQASVEDDDAPVTNSLNDAISRVIAGEGSLADFSIVGLIGEGGITPEELSAINTVIKDDDRDIVSLAQVQEIIFAVESLNLIASLNDDTSILQSQLDILGITPSLSDTELDALNEALDDPDAFDPTNDPIGLQNLTNSVIAVLEGNGNAQDLINVGITNSDTISNNE